MLLTDATGVTAKQALTITIIANLTISTTSPLPTGEVGITYSQTLAATGGTAPYTWSVTGGALPQGLSLSPGGSITGKPGAAGTASIKVQVTDSSQLTASATLALTIAAEGSGNCRHSGHAQRRIFEFELLSRRWQPCRATGVGAFTPGRSPTQPPRRYPRGSLFLRRA